MTVPRHLLRRLTVLSEKDALSKQHLTAAATAVRHLPASVLAPSSSNGTRGSDGLPIANALRKESVRHAPSASMTDIAVLCAATSAVHAATAHAAPNKDAVTDGDPDTPIVLPKTIAALHTLCNELLSRNAVDFLAPVKTSPTKSDNRSSVVNNGASTSAENVETVAVQWEPLVAILAALGDSPARHSQWTCELWDKVTALLTHNWADTSLSSPLSSVSVWSSSAPITHHTLHQGSSASLSSSRPCLIVRPATAKQLLQVLRVAALPAFAHSNAAATCAVSALSLLPDTPEATANTSAVNDAVMKILQGAVKNQSLWAVAAFTEVFPDKPLPASTSSPDHVVERSSGELSHRCEELLQTFKASDPTADSHATKPSLEAAWELVAAACEMVMSGSTSMSGESHSNSSVDSAASYAIICAHALNALSRYAIPDPIAEQLLLHSLIEILTARGASLFQETEDRSQTISSGDVAVIQRVLERAMGGPASCGDHHAHLCRAAAHALSLVPEVEATNADNGPAATDDVKTSTSSALATLESPAVTLMESVAACLRGAPHQHHVRAVALAAQTGVGAPDDCVLGCSALLATGRGGSAELSLLEQTLPLVSSPHVLAVVVRALQAEQQLHAGGQRRAEPEEATPAEDSTEDDLRRLGISLDAHVSEETQPADGGSADPDAVADAKSGRSTKPKRTFETVAPPLILERQRRFFDECGPSVVFPLLRSSAELGIMSKSDSASNSVADSAAMGDRDAAQWAQASAFTAVSSVLLASSGAFGAGATAAVTAWFDMCFSRGLDAMVRSHNTTFAPLLEHGFDYFSPTCGLIDSSLTNAPATDESHSTDLSLSSAAGGHSAPVGVSSSASSFAALSMSVGFVQSMGCLLSDIAASTSSLERHGHAAHAVLELMLSTTAFRRVVDFLSNDETTDHVSSADVENMRTEVIEALLALLEGFAAVDVADRRLTSAMSAALPNALPHMTSAQCTAFTRAMASLDASDVLSSSPSTQASHLERKDVSWHHLCRTRAVLTAKTLESKAEALTSLLPDVGVDRLGEPQVGGVAFTLQKLRLRKANATATDPRTTPELLRQLGATVAAAAAASLPIDQSLGVPSADDSNMSSPSDCSSSDTSRVIHDEIALLFWSGEDLLRSVQDSSSWSVADASVIATALASFHQTVAKSLAPIDPHTVSSLLSVRELEVIETLQERTEAALVSILRQLSVAVQQGESVPSSTIINASFSLASVTENPIASLPSPSQGGETTNTSTNETTTTASDVADDDNASSGASESDRRTQQQQRSQQRSCAVLSLPPGDVADLLEWATGEGLRDVLLVDLIKCARVIAFFESHGLLRSSFSAATGGRSKYKLSTRSAEYTHALAMHAALLVAVSGTLTVGGTTPFSTNRSSAQSSLSDSSAAVGVLNAPSSRSKANGASHSPALAALKAELQSQRIAAHVELCGGKSNRRNAAHTRTTMECRSSGVAANNQNVGAVNLHAPDASVTPDTLSTFVFRLSQAGALQSEPVHNLAEFCVDHCEMFTTGSQVVRLLAGFSAMQVTKRDVYLVFSERLKKRPILYSLALHEVSLALGAFGDAKFLDEALTKELNARIEQDTRALGPQDVALAVHAHTSLCLTNDDFYDNMSDRALQLATSFTAGGAVMTLRSLVNAGVPRFDTYDAMIDTITADIGQLPTPIVASVLPLCASIGYNDDRLEQIAEHVAENAHELPEKAVIESCAALQELNWRHPKLLTALGDQAVRLHADENLEPQGARVALDTLAYFTLPHQVARMQLSAAARSVSRETLPEGDDKAWNKLKFDPGVGVPVITE